MISAESVTSALVERGAEREAAAAFTERLTAALSAECADLRLDEPSFAAHLLSRPAGQRPALEALAVPDIAIAFACARGDRAALSYLDAQFLPKVRPAIARVVPEAAAIDDVLQALRSRVLLPDPGGSGAPRIATYAGEAPLVAWLRAAAVRVALNSVRGARPEHSDEDALQEAPAALDLETETLKGLHRESFERAFRASLDALTPRERTLLKLHFVDGMSLEQIGGMYRAHKSTISRWLAAARGQLLDATRDRLATELGIDGAEVRSLVRLIRSRVSLGLSHLLRR